MYIWVVLLICLHFFIVGGQFPNPIAFSSPFPGYVHDPTIAKINKEYYVFLTHNNVSITTSSSLQGPWKTVGDVLPQGSKINYAGRYDIWAPDVSLYEGVFHLFYAVSTFGSQTSAIGLAVSKTLAPGTWTDLGLIFATATGAPYNAIDPNLVVDRASSQPFLNFGSYWNDIYQIPLASNANSTLSGKTPIQLAYNSTGEHSEEGSFVYYYQNYYYLFYSNGQCCNMNPLPAPGDEYKVYVGRSTAVTGPYVDKTGKDLKAGGGTLFLGSHDNVYAPGGQSLFYDADIGRTLIVYHYFLRNNLNTCTLGINYVNFEDGWPVLASS
jgi:arabinan endo-1,5-alpha-L-arabinosidase